MYSQLPATVATPSMPEPAPGNLTLISHHLCPYVQRAVVSLTEKRVPFARDYVDLGNKPDWFKALSPLGKVPILRVVNDDGEHAIFESAVILEYLEETQSNPLLPPSPLERAAHRAWMEFGSSVLDDIAGFYRAVGETAFRTKTDTLRGKFARLETVLESGPYFAGEHFSLVDAVFGPIFRYFDVFDAIGDFGILGGIPKVMAWRAALSERPSIRDAVVVDYPDRLRHFLRTRNGYLATLIR